LRESGLIEHLLDKNALGNLQEGLHVFPARLTYAEALPGILSREFAVQRQGADFLFRALIPGFKERTEARLSGPRDERQNQILNHALLIDQSLYLFARDLAVSHDYQLSAFLGLTALYAAIDQANEHTHLKDVVSDLHRYREHLSEHQVYREFSWANLAAFNFLNVLSLDLAKTIKDIVIAEVDDELAQALIGPEGLVARTLKAVIDMRERVRPRDEKIRGNSLGVAEILRHNPAVTLQALAEAVGKSPGDLSFRAEVLAYIQTLPKIVLHEHASGLITAEHLLPYYLEDSDKAREARRRFALVVTSNRSGLDLQANPVDPGQISQERADAIFAERVGFPDNDASFQISVENLKRFVTYTDSDAKDWDEFETKFAVIKTVTDVDENFRHQLMREGILKQVREDNLRHIEITDYHSKSIERVTQMALELEKELEGRVDISILKAFRKDHLDNLMREEKPKKDELRKFEGRNWSEVQQDILDELMAKERLRFGLDQDTVRREFREVLSEMERQLRRGGKVTDAERRERLILAYAARERAYQDIRKFEKEIDDIEIRHPDVRKRIVGISSIGDEVNYINWIEAPILRRAAEIGLRITSHVGERWLPGEYIPALERIKREIEIGVDRIAHATVLGLDFDQVKDISPYSRRKVQRLQKEIFDLIRRKGIHVEALPTSNVRLAPSFNQYSQHGTKRFLKERISFSLHPDDSSVYDTNPSKELAEIWFGNPDIRVDQLFQTLDEAKAYRFHQPVEEVVQGLMDERNRVAEIQKALIAAVVVFGSARIPKLILMRQHPLYALGYKLGQKMWERGLVPRTGGGPGIMAFILEGYLRARADAGYPVTKREMTQAIRILFNWFEPTNEFVEFVYDFHHFVFRKLGLHINSLGIIAMNGGIGTLDEVFEVWRRERNVVLLGAGFWTPLIQAFVESWQKAGILDQIRMRPHITDDVDDALSHIIQPSEEKDIPLLDEDSMRVANFEMSDGILKLSRLPRAVAIVGRPHPESKDLGTLKDLTQALIGRGVPVRASSRGPVLEAVHAAAAAIQREDAVQTVIYGSPKDLDWTALETKIRDDYPDATVLTRDDSNHQVLLSYDARGFVFLPGGVGTMNKLFDVVQIMQTAKVRRRPIVLVGREFWTPILKAIEKAMLEHNPPMIAFKDMHLMQVVDTAEEALEILGINGTNGNGQAASLGQAESVQKRLEKMIKMDLELKKSTEAFIRFVRRVNKKKSHKIAAAVNALEDDIKNVGFPRLVSIQNVMSQVIMVLRVWKSLKEGFRTRLNKSLDNGTRLVEERRDLDRQIEDLMKVPELKSASLPPVTDRVSHKDWVRIYGTWQALLIGRKVEEFSEWNERLYNEMKPAPLAIRKWAQGETDNPDEIRRIADMLERASQRTFFNQDEDLSETDRRNLKGIADSLRALLPSKPVEPEMPQPERIAPATGQRSFNFDDDTKHPSGKSLGEEQRIVEDVTRHIARIYAPERRQEELTRLGILESAASLGAYQELPPLAQALLAPGTEFGVTVANISSLENVEPLEDLMASKSNKMLIAYVRGPVDLARLEEKNKEYESKFQGRIRLVSGHELNGQDYPTFVQSLVRGGGKFADLIRRDANQWYRRSGYSGDLTRNHSEFLKFLTVVAPENDFERLQLPFIRPFFSKDFNWDADVREFAETFYAVLGSGVSDAALLHKQVGDDLDLRLSRDGLKVEGLALNENSLARYSELLTAVQSARVILARAA